MVIKFGESELTLSEQGLITDITYRQKSVFPGGQLSYLIRLFRDGQPCEIRKVSLEGDVLTYCFEGTEDRVSLKRIYNEDYTVLEVTECPESFDFLTVGPIVTRLNEMVGDVVGVVQGEGAAIGIQGLSRKLLAGFPEELRPHVIHDIQAVSSELTVGNINAGTVAAYAMPFGSVLQLFCENRRRDRIKTVWYAENCIQAPALDREDADIRGSRVALFACPAEEALAVIGRIEEREGLPHPVLDGEWLKTSRKAKCSYLIGEFGADNIDKMLSYAEKGGFTWLYHPEPFCTWGHFELRKEQFPEGDQSLKRCVEEAKERGIRLGLHTLSTFTKTNDSYVTPVPDKGLKGMIPGVLETDIGEEETEIPVSEVAGLAYGATLNCIRIEDELIQYAGYEEISQGRFLLKGCTRGAFGTKSCTHGKGCAVSKMTDYPYHTLFPDIDLQDKYADRLAELYHSTGVRQISFDGLEGAEWTGEGEYAVNSFCMRFYEQFMLRNKSDSRSNDNGITPATDFGSGSGVNSGAVENDFPVINDASRLHHFLWHMNTRMNWGEPWGEEMRAGQVEGRMRNQAFFKKNLLPGMLGWFLIRKANRRFEASTLLDMEWALSEAAGFDAGFALSASLDTLDALGSGDEILEAIRNWELLRYENRFDDELKELLKKPETEWHLEKENERLFRLYPMAVSKPLVCDLLEMQPGQPGGSDWSFEQPFERQVFTFRMKVDGNGYIVNPRFYNTSGVVQFQATVKGGQYLLFDGSRAFVTDRNYNKLEEVRYTGNCLVEKGNASLSFGCTFGGEEGPEVRVRVSTKSEPYSIKRE